MSLYVDQKPEDDQSEARAKEFGFKVYPTIAEALRCGGDKLAVDGVLVIGEHGDYPVNDKGQILYPRYEFFEQVAKVFEADGRSVPVFNDKHLSYSFDKASQMVADSQAAGLSVPGRLEPAGHLAAAGRRAAARRCTIEEALMVGVGGSDPMDLPRARGDAVHARTPPRRRDRRASRAADRRARGLEGRHATAAGRAACSKRPSRAPPRALGKAWTTAARRTCTRSGELEELVKEPAAYLIEYSDGLRATLLMLNGAVHDYNFACQVRGNPQHPIDAVPAARAAQRGLFDLPDAQGRRDDHHRRGPLSRRADAVGQRHPGHVPGVEGARQPSPGHAEPAHHLPPGRHVAVLRSAGTSSKWPLARVAVWYLVPRVDCQPAQAPITSTPA